MRSAPRTDSVPAGATAPPCSCWEIAGLGLHSNPPPLFMKMGGQAGGHSAPWTPAPSTVSTGHHGDAAGKLRPRFTARGPGFGGGNQGCLTRPRRTHVSNRDRSAQAGTRLPAAPRPHGAKGKESSLGVAAPGPTRHPSTPAPWPASPASPPARIHASGRRPASDNQAGGGAGRRCSSPARRCGARQADRRPRTSLRPQLKHESGSPPELLTSGPDHSPQGQSWALGR